MNKEQYAEMTERLLGLCEGVSWWVTNLSNAAALLYDTLTDINWAGFYLLKDGALELGPFQGKPACTRIAIGRGVCGTAVRENRVQRVEDVHAFAGHIACDAASRSEIVLPLRLHGRIFGVLDIDSPLTGRFSEEDEEGLAAFAEAIERVMERCE